MLDRADVDTDQIIPKQFLKRIERTGYGEFLFYDWRRDPSFELNRPEYAGATILVTGTELRLRLVTRARGVGAPGLRLRGRVAPSFGDIFASNSAQIGLAARHAAGGAGAWADGRDGADRRPRGADDHGARKSGRSRFEFDPFRRPCLLNGLDDIGLTLEHEDEITAFESGRQAPVDTAKLPT